MFLNCHSPAMFHDLRLRGGSQGTFSRIATERNYEMSKLLLGIESPNPNDSRIIAKNLYPPSQMAGGEGLPHRGGSLLEDFGPGQRATPDKCAGIDVTTANLDDVPAYCVLVQWHQVERDQAIMRGEIFDDSNVVQSLVWVARPKGVGTITDFDTFRGNADLRSAPVTYAADGSISLGPSTSLLAACGVPAGADVRTPAVSWDGKKLAFAARATASDPLRLYWMPTDGSGPCVQIPGIAPAMNQENGILTHDFDPAFAPDGRIVFASTRGNLDRSHFAWTGPTRTPAAMQPNANLYVFDPATGDLGQMTYLLDQELAPNFMADGRLIFTAEKREPGFHQLAGRRENMDGADYHPLFAQRDSVGFQAATEIVEAENRDIAFVAGPIDAPESVGTIVFANRSIGPDQDDRDPADRFYIHSMRFPVPSAVPLFSRGATMGVFRSPAALPTGGIVVSCDLHGDQRRARRRSLRLRPVPARPEHG